MPSLLWNGTCLSGTTQHIGYHWFDQACNTKLASYHKQSEHLGSPSHASDGAFPPDEIMSKTIDFERPGGREWLPSATPFEFFCTFFGSVFGPARVQISSTSVLRSVVFCSVKKRCSKAPKGYAAWGLPQGSTFACAVTTINKTKKLKLKKMEPNCSIVVTAFSLRFHSVRQIVLLW